jgi:crossover junction endodeoxyribonuclease RusA
MQLFEFVVAGPPVSQQTRRRRRLEEWKRVVTSAAAAAWVEGDGRFSGELTISILYFYEFARVDVDNIIKPIHDALQGLVFDDDIQVSDSIVRRRHLRGEFVLQGISAVLALGIDSGREFLYVRVNDAPAAGELTL